MVFGKVVGGLIGLVAGGIPGAIFGGFIGHVFDNSLGRALGQGTTASIERIQNSFFETTFLLSGYLAKIDGRISKSEIDHTEQFIAHMGLTGPQRQRAIDLFRKGAARNFEVEPVVTAFLQTCGPQQQMQQTLLMFLISLAHADQTITPAEHGALLRIANLMGLRGAQLERMLRMSRAQDHFHQQAGPAPRRGNTLDEAYVALGIDKSVSDQTVKRAYRKLMSENHPDKLSANGVPDEMIKLATERTQEIQTAYELIRKTRPGIR